MTTYEHAMLGISGTLAAGLHRRYGWQIVAVAGVVAVLPDWDGLSILFGAGLFDLVHRAAGHNLLVAGLLGAAVAALDYCFDLTGRVRQFVGRRLPVLARPNPAATRRRFRPAELGAWIAAGVFFSLTHLAVDVVFSGHATLSDWGLKLFWPFSDRAWAYPTVPWGDVGTTLIFAAGMFAMLRWPKRLQTIAALTLACVLAYIGARGSIPG